MESHSSRMNMRTLPRDATAVGRRVVLVSLACVATGFALAQSAELPNRRDVIEGVTAEVLDGQMLRLDVLSVAAR